MNTKNIYQLLVTAILILVSSGCSDDLGYDVNKFYPSSKQDYISNPKINGHEAVDMGLSVMWAACNVGAKDDKPEEYGSYFAWGETSEKSTYTLDNSVTDGKSMSDISGNATYDAARKNWGGTWRMPTRAEIRELIANTTTTRKTQNGVYGRLVTSKINGNSIFLPAAGGRYDDLLYGAGELGLYWSSTPYEGYTYGAYGLDFSSGNFGWDWNLRYSGQGVRAVTE